MADSELTEGQRLIHHTWFCTLRELHDLVHAESPADRIAAGDVLLRYYTSMSQSLNPPFIPDKDPIDEDDDDDSVH